MSKITLELSENQTSYLKNFIIRSLDLMKREEREIRELSVQAAKHIGMERISAECEITAKEYHNWINIAQDLYKQISRQEQMQEWIKGGKEQP